MPQIEAMLVMLSTEIDGNSSLNAVEDAPLDFRDFGLEQLFSSIPLSLFAACLFAADLLGFDPLFELLLDELGLELLVGFGGTTGFISGASMVTSVSESELSGNTGSEVSPRSRTPSGPHDTVFNGRYFKCSLVYSL